MKEQNRQRNQGQGTIFVTNAEPIAERKVECVVIFSRAIIGFKITQKKESMKILGSSGQIKSHIQRPPPSLLRKIAPAAICVFGFQCVFQGNANLIQECLFVSNHLVGK